MGRPFSRGGAGHSSLWARPAAVRCVTFHCVDAPEDQAARPLREVHEELVGTLAAAGVPDPEVDAELLIGHVLGLSRGGVQARLVIGGGLFLGFRNFRQKGSR